MLDNIRTDACAGKHGRFRTKSWGVGALLARRPGLTVHTDVTSYGQNMFGAKCEIHAPPPPRVGPFAAV
jgi:hypothetical protein